MNTRQKQILKNKRIETNILTMIYIVLMIIFLFLIHDKKELKRNEFLENLNSGKYAILDFPNEFNFENIARDFGLDIGDEEKNWSIEEQVKHLEEYGIKVGYIDKKDIVVYDENLTSEFIEYIYDMKK